MVAKFPVRSVALAALLLQVACTCAVPSARDTSYACTADVDCASGFRCLDGVCRTEASPDAGEPDGGDAGATDGGNDGGMTGATQLAVTPETVRRRVGECVGPFTVETRDEDGPVVLARPLAIELSSMPSGLVVYSDVQCTLPVTQLTVPAGASSTLFAVREAMAGEWELTLSAAGLDPATATVTLIDAPTSLALEGTVPTPLLAGRCFELQAEAQRGGMPQPVVDDTPLSIVSVPAGAARFFADAACTQPLSTTIAAGESSRSVFVKPVTGGTVVVTATTSFGSDSRSLTVAPAMRRGTCSYRAAQQLPDGGPDVQTLLYCDFSPALTDAGQAVSMFQTSALGDQLDSNLARCRIFDADTVSCRRERGESAMTVHWQVLELPGIASRRGFDDLGTTGEEIDAGRSFDLDHTFTLRSVSTASPVLNSQELTIGRMVSPNRFRLEFGTNATTTAQGNWEWQAVEWSGVNVTRGFVDGGVPMGETQVAVSGLPATSTNTVLLTQVTVGNDPVPMCGLLVRGTMPSPSSLEFTRGAGGDGGCAVAPVPRVYWERIDFGQRANVQTKTVTLAPGSAEMMVPVTPVDATRTLVFGSGQLLGGQGTGETSFAGGYAVGEGAARFELAANDTVRVVRQRTVSNATFTFYVVEVEP